MNYEIASPDRPAIPDQDMAAYPVTDRNVQKSLASRGDTKYS